MAWPLSRITAVIRPWRLASTQGGMLMSRTASSRTASPTASSRTRSKGAEERGSKGAETWGSKGAEEQGRGGANSAFGVFSLRNSAFHLFQSSQRTASQPRMSTAHRDHPRQRPPNRVRNCQSRGQTAVPRAKAVPVQAAASQCERGLRHPSSSSAPGSSKKSRVSSSRLPCRVNV